MKKLQRSSRKVSRRLAPYVKPEHQRLLERVQLHTQAPKKLQGSSSKVSGRRTLYVKPEHQELLGWVQRYTQAHSLSEAVFSALSELKALIKERQFQALEQTHGIWKDDPRIAEAFKDLEKGWERWRHQLEGS